MQSKTLLFCITSMMLLSIPHTIKSENKANAMTTKNESGKIKLFVYKGCPWCKKVIEFLKQIGHFDKIILMDLAITANMQELQKLNNGNTQAPYLSDEPKGVGMLESSDIIDYFKTRF